MDGKADEGPVHTAGGGAQGRRSGLSENMDHGTACTCCALRAHAAPDRTVLHGRPPRRSRLFGGSGCRGDAGRVLHGCAQLRDCLPLPREGREGGAWRIPCEAQPRRGRRTCRRDHSRRCRDDVGQGGRRPGGGDSQATLCRLWRRVLSDPRPRTLCGEELRTAQPRRDVAWMFLQLRVLFRHEVL